MDAQLVGKDGSIIELNDEQYEKILAMLGIVRLCPDEPLSEEDTRMILAEIEGINQDWKTFMHELAEDMSPDRVFEWWQQRRTQNAQ